MGEDGGYTNLVDENGQPLETAGKLKNRFKPTSYYFPVDRLRFCSIRLGGKKRNCDCAQFLNTIKILKFNVENFLVWKIITSLKTFAYTLLTIHSNDVSTHKS